MKCLRKFKWVKLQRDQIPGCGGIMGFYLKLAARAAFRKGKHHYCGFTNPVEPGMWSGGVVGLKSILGVRKRHQALLILNQLQELGYISYTLDSKTKKLTYQIAHWVTQCCGAASMNGVAHTTDGYGFLCMPRDITENLLVRGMVFDESAAWLDLWCHTVYQDYGNAFSFLAPAVQYGKYGSVLTLENLGKRWGWEKTKVWRFFRKHRDVFCLHRLPGAYGCVIFNCAYPTGDNFDMPDDADVVSILELVRISARNTYTEGSDNQRINRFVAWKSRRIMRKLQEKCAHNESGEKGSPANPQECRVAHSAPYTRAYFSHGRNCKHGRNCIYACQGNYLGGTVNLEIFDIGVPYPFFGDPFFNDDS